MSSLSVVSFRLLSGEARWRRLRVAQQRRMCAFLKGEGENKGRRLSGLFFSIRVSIAQIAWQIDDVHSLHQYPCESIGGESRRIGMGRLIGMHAQLLRVVIFLRWMQGRRNPLTRWLAE